MYKLIKRLFDLLASIIAILLITPVLLPVMIILRFTGEGEVFYLQERVGINNKKFRVIKFATMLKNSEKMGSGIYTAKNDSRILPIGNFLRKTKINELPQIFNILIGDISIVGPRPLIKRTYDLYSLEDKNIISKMKPGLTGIGSIIFRNEEELLLKADGDIEEFYEKNITPHKANLEKWYFDNASLKIDILIIFLTAWVIFFKNSKQPSKIFKDLPKFSLEDI